MESIKRWRVSVSFYGTIGRERKIRYQFLHVSFTKDRCELNETFWNQAKYEAWEIIKEKKPKIHNNRIEVHVSKSRFDGTFDTSDLLPQEKRLFTIGENDVY